MVELLDLSDVSLSHTDPFEGDFRTSTPRKGFTEPSFVGCRESSRVFISPPGPPPPVPQKPKPQTAITKSTVEDIEFSMAEKSLRKFSSAKELLESWYNEMSGSQKLNSTSAVLLKRRHSEILRRRFTTSIKDSQMSLEIVPENDLTDTSQCIRLHSNASLSYSGQARKSFVRNCPVRKARRSRVTSSRSVVMEKSSAPSVSETAPGLYPSALGKMDRCGKGDLQIPNFVGKNCDCNISFIAFV